jgi:thiosulfate sulfurtransferase
LATEKGYTNIYVYREGIIGWAKAKNRFESTASYTKELIPLISANNLANESNVDAVILDIRPYDHFQNGHINGALNIDLEDLHEKIGYLPKDKRIILVDHKGKLTLITGRYLRSQGFEDILRLDGGFNGWVKSGKQVTR